MATLATQGGPNDTKRATLTTQCRQNDAQWTPNDLPRPPKWGKKDEENEENEEDETRQDQGPEPDRLRGAKVGIKSSLFPR